MEKLLESHPNLYMSIKVRKTEGGGGFNVPFDMGAIDSRWLALMKEHTDHFMIGTDQFYQPSQAKRRQRISVPGSVKLLKELPQELARKVGYEKRGARL